MKKIIQQVIYDIQGQPFVSWISLIGTTLAIFLVMALYMLENVNNVESEPENNRSRLYYGMGLEIKNLSPGGGDGSSFSSLPVAKRFYDGLEGVEDVSYVTAWSEKKDLQYGKGEAIESTVKWVDDKFWKIHGFKFSEGRGFDCADWESGVKKAIITRQLADRLFGKGEKAEGMEVNIDLMPYVVTGVVDNANPLLTQSYAQAYLPLGDGVSFEESSDYPYFGSVKAILLAKEGIPVEKLRKQVERRYQQFNIQLKDEEKEVIYHGQPYSSKVVAEQSFGTNNTPDFETHEVRRWTIYIVLLLLPAINLSTMTRSRMKRRVSEIAVRRAFGAKKLQILMQLLTENLVLTLAGGILGLILSLWFATNLSPYVALILNDWDASFEQLISAPSLGLVFSWKVFVLTLVFCVLLNIFSAGLPAWKSARENPAEALGGRGK